MILLLKPTEQLTLLVNTTKPGIWVSFWERLSAIERGNKYQMPVCGCYTKQPSRGPLLIFLALAAGDMVHAYFFGFKRTFMYKWNLL